ncbi:MAG: serine hydrolase, partial [Planctomycetota bacterium]
MARVLCAFLTIVFLVRPCAAQPGDWARMEPAYAGFDGAELREAIAFAIENETRASRDLIAEHAVTRGREPFDEAVGPLKPRGEMSGVIVRRGAIVAEWGEPGRVDMTFSVSKTFLSAVVGLAMDDGLIDSPDETVFERLGIPEFESEHNRRVTWDHLLRQTSDWEGLLFGKPDWADRPGRDLRAWRDRARNEPGSVYDYNDVRVNALALAATHVWRRPIQRVLRERIMDPIGASRTWRWHGYETSWIELDGQMVQVPSGGGHWGGGMFISAYDQARFGLFLLRRGEWEGERLLSERFFDLAETQTDAEGDGRPLPGYMNFFVNTGRERMPSAPESAGVHLGSGTNMIYVDR